MPQEMRRISPEKIMDNLSGMVTMEQAERIANGDFGAPHLLEKGTKSAFTAGELADILAAAAANPLGIANDSAIRINLKDKIYRVFNPVLYQKEKYERRSIVAGIEDKTVTVNLLARQSEQIDTVPFERGDEIVMNGLILDPKNLSLSSTHATTFKKTSPTDIKPVTDYSSFEGESKCADVIGRVVEIEPIRYTKAMGAAREVPVSSCKISDGHQIAEAALWSSSALSTTRLAINSWLKMEFCSIKRSDGKLIITAGESSRIVSNQCFGTKK